MDINKIIQQINDQIDGQALARLINYHADKIQINGSTLKCFCPVHNERAFRSLIFDLKNKSHKCMMKHCSCFEGGTFVAFWSIYKQLEPINAARDLADKLKLAIDLGILQELSANYAAEATEALQEGQYVLAREKADEALALDPRNQELRKLSALIWHESGDSERALAERLALANDLLEAGELAALESLFEELEQLHTGELAVQVCRVRWARQSGERTALAACLAALAEMHVAGDDIPAAAMALHEASELDENPTLLSRLAELYEQIEDSAALRTTLRRLAALCERRGEQHSTLQAYERLAALEPENCELAERVAVLQAELGSPEQARELWLDLATKHAAGGRGGEALAILDKLVAAAPQDIALLERRARLQQEIGRSAEAIDGWRALAKMAREVGLAEKVNEYYEQARTIDPNDAGLREDLAAWKLHRGDVDGGLADLFSLAEMLLEQGNEARGMGVLEHIVSLAPTSLDKRLRVGRCLERNGLAAEAFAAYAKLVRDLLSQQQHDAALAICEELKRLRPLDAQTLEFRIEAHLALKQKMEAIEACRDAARAWLASGEPRAEAEAEAALQRGIKLDRTETCAKTDLARLFESTGRVAAAVPLWTEMALFYRAQAQPAAANEAIREALRLDPKNREAKQMLAEGLEAAGSLGEALALWRELATALLEEHQDQAAHKLLLHALELAPRDAWLLERTSKLALELQTNAEAKPLVARWLGSFDGQEAPAGALDAYRLAVKHFAAEAGWRERLAELLLKADETEEAAEQLELLLGIYREQRMPAAQQTNVLNQLVALCPERTDLRANQAELLCAQGMKREAALLYQELAEGSLQHGALEEGLNYFGQAHEADAENGDLLARYAALMERTGNTKAALPLFEALVNLRRRETDRTATAAVLEKLIGYEPSRFDLRAELAEIYELEGDVDRAVEHSYKLAQSYAGDPSQSGRMVTICKKMRTLAPEFVPGRELLIDAWLRQQAFSEAKQELDALGDLALKENQLERAEGYFKRVLEIDPDDIGSGERLGKLYEARGRFDEAAQAFEHVLALYEKMSETARVIGVLQKLKGLRPEDLTLRRRLARALLHGSAAKQEAGAEWLELIRLAIDQSEADLLDQALSETNPIFQNEWAWRTQLARTLVEAGERALALEQWQAQAQDALTAREFETAREAAGEGLRLDGGAKALRELRIEANRRLSNYDSAAEDLRELAERAAAGDENAVAKGHLQAALELKPKDPELLEMLAEIETALGETAGATATLRRLCEHYHAAGQWDAALVRAKKICTLNPGATEWLDFHADLLQHAGRQGEALEVWRAIAEAAAAEGRCEQALARYARILEYLPGDIATLRHLADLSYEQGGMHQAMGHYDRLVDALHAAGNAPAIEAEYKRILELESGHLQMKERYADFLREQLRRDEARAMFQEVITAYCDDREEPAEAARVLRRLRALEPDNLDLREQEAGLLEALGSREEAARAWHDLAELLRRAGRGPQAAQATLKRAALLGDDAETQREAAEFFEEYADPERATQFYLRAIEILDRNDQLDPCVGILERAMRLNPMRLDLADALARLLERLGQMARATQEWLALGDKYEGRGQNAQAATIYKHVRTLLPAERECRRRLTRLHEVEGNRTALIAELRDLAQLAGNQGDFEEAAAHLGKLLEVDPQDEAALTALAALWRALKRSDELFATLSTLGRIYCASGRHEAAVANLEALRVIKPDEPELLAQMMELLIQTGKPAQAAQQGIELIQICFDRKDDHRALDVLHRIVEIEPGNIERRISLARLVQANGRDADAMQEFFLSATKLAGEGHAEGALLVCEAGLQLYSDDMRLRDLMARALLKLGRKAEAIEVQLHLAALYDERGEGSKAQRVFESILADQPDHQGTLEAMIEWALRHKKFNVAVEQLVALAEAYYLEGNLKSSIATLERIQEYDATRFDLRARLAEVYWEAGAGDKARATWLETALAYVEQGQAEASIEVFERLLELDPENLEALAGLTQARAALGHTEQHKAGALELSAKYVAAGRVDEALELLETLTELYPQEAEPWQQLSALYAEQNATIPAVRAYQRLAAVHQGARRLDAARLAYAAALELQPENVELLEELGDVCLQLGRRPEALEYLAQACRSLAAAGEWSRTKAIAERLLKLDPLNLPLRHLLAEALEAQGEREAALREFIQAARGYAEAHQNLESLTVLQHILTLDPANAEERELYAKLLHREGRTDESILQYLLLLDSLGEDEDPRRAIKYCRLVLGEQPEHAGAHEHLCAVYERTDKLRQAFRECEWLASHYAGAGQPHETEKYLRKGLGWFPEEAVMRTRLIELLEQTGQVPAAVKQLAELAAQAEARSEIEVTRWALEKACALEPTNLEHPRKFADHLERQGDSAGARLARLNLTKLLLAGGAMEEARALAERLAESNPGPDLRVALAQIFEDAGLPEVAAFHFHALARASLLDSKFEEAKAWANQALMLKPRHVGAREVLIAALRAQGDNRSAIREYEALVELYKSAGEFEMALTTLNALVELTPSAPEPRRELIELYRRLRREDSLLEQLRRLAEIYVNAGDCQNAVNCFKEVMKSCPDDTHTRVRYIDLYTQMGDESELRDDYMHLARIYSRKGAMVEATHTYEKLLATHPKDSGCREQFVQFLFEQGQVTRGVEETRGLAALLENEGRFQDAGRALDRALNFAPDELELRQRLAGIYLQTNRRGMALEAFRSLARTYEQMGQEDQLLEVFTQIVAIDGLNVEFRQRLADLLQRRGETVAAGEHFRKLADQYLERGLFDLAEHEYRRMLEMHPDETELWEKVIENHLQIGTLEEVVPDLMMLAELYLNQEQLKKAVEAYRNILKAEPDNIDILRRYIDVYQQIGLEQDLLDEYLKLADLRVQRGEISEAIRIYKHLMELKPDDEGLRERLTATQGMSGRPRDGLSATSTRRMENMKQAELMKMIRNYQNVLKLNPNNPSARVKLAELYEHSGDVARADEHWLLASESYFTKGDLLRCIEICERFLVRHNEHQLMKDRLSAARVQYDSMRAIDGAISSSAGF